jgi:cytochrome c-type biogenesis protein CcmH
MTDGHDPARDHAPMVPAGVVLRRIAVTLAIIVAITVSGIAIYRNQRDRAGMPVVLPPPPVVRETTAPTVEDVITRLERQVQDKPDDADGWRNLGWSYFQRGKYAEAVDALRHATRSDPTDARTFSFLGEALLQVHKAQRRMPREARAAFDAALRLDPKDARARYYRAVGWDLSGQHHRAIHAWFALLRETPPDAPYADDIRAVIRTVGARHHIKVEKRLAEVVYTPPAPPPASTIAAKPARPVHTRLPGMMGDRMRAVEGVPTAEASEPATEK